MGKNALVSFAIGVWKGVWKELEAVSYVGFGGYVTDKGKVK